MTDQSQHGSGNNQVKQTHQHNDQVNGNSNAEPKQSYDKVQDGNLSVSLWRN